MIKVVLTLFLFLHYVKTDIMTKFIAPKCRYDEDCGLNFYCKENSVCVCKTGYLPTISNNSALCLKEAVAIGDPCIENIQCTAAFGTKAECVKEKQGISGRCQCIWGAHFEDNLCYPSIPIGGHCQASAECKAKSNTSTFCDAGKCVCPYNYHPNEDGSDCLKSSNIGEACHNDDECVAHNSRCLEVCRCKLNYVLSYDAKRCLPVVDTLGGECHEDGQCQERLMNSVCNSITEWCTCSLAATFKDGYCWSISDLGEPCEDSRECVIKSENSAAVVCSNKKCSCAPGFRTNLRANDCISGSSLSSYAQIEGLSFKLTIIFNLFLCTYINLFCI